MQTPINRLPPDDCKKLRIYLLGRFQVLRDGEPMGFGRKLPKKPLSVLKWLTAAAGQSTDVLVIADRIWPDLEGDAARRAFDIALYRLRKILGVRGLLVLAGGRLSIDSAKCWIDVCEFAATVEKIEHVMAAPSQAGDAECKMLAEDLLALYSGHLLESETQEDWVIPCRDQLLEKFRRAVLNLAACLEHHKRWDLAAALYTRALELDNLAEPLYRRLMLCYRELGETAEALRVFRRCRDLLSVVLSTSPSAETRAVHATLAYRFAGKPE